MNELIDSCDSYTAQLLRELRTKPPKKTRKATHHLLRFADANEYPLSLTPEDWWGSSVPRLRRFYESFGFVAVRDATSCTDGHARRRREAAW